MLYFPPGATTTALRPDGRQPDQMHQLRIAASYLAHIGGLGPHQGSPTMLLLANVIMRHVALTASSLVHTRGREYDGAKDVLVLKRKEEA